MFAAQLPLLSQDPYAKLCMGNLAYAQSDTLDDKEWDRLIRAAFGHYKDVLKARSARVGWWRGVACFSGWRWRLARVVLML